MILRENASALKGTHFFLVRMYVTPYHSFWIIFTSDLVIRCTEKLLVFKWVQIMLLL